MNGILAGLVSIAGPCAVVDAWASVIIGFIGAFVYFASSRLLLRLKIDDPLDASPVHLFCGIWGVIASGLFANKEFTNSVYGTDYGENDYGLFMGANSTQLGVQVVGVLVIGSWTFVSAGLVFFTLKATKLLRVSAEDEDAGLDSSHHGGDAYNFAAGKPSRI